MVAKLLILIRIRLAIFDLLNYFISPLIIRNSLHPVIQFTFERNKDG